MPLPQRRSPRLPGYDYSQSGAYFVTFCTHQRTHLLGHVEAGQVCLNEAGAEVLRCHEALSERFLGIQLDEMVVMPNHVHAIIWLDGVRTGQAPSLQAVVGAWKSLSARGINQRRRMTGAPVWQQRFYDHIIRSETDLERIRLYIQQNPEKWVSDRFYNERACPSTRLSRKS